MMASACCQELARRRVVSFGSCQNAEVVQKPGDLLAIADFAREQQALFVQPPGGDGVALTRGQNARGPQRPGALRLCLA